MLLPFVCLVGWSCQEAKVTEAGPDDSQLQVTEEGIISSINRDWGFLVVQMNGGTALEVGNSRLLSSRSGDVFGEVLVCALEGDRAVVEFIPGSGSSSKQPGIGELVALAP